MSAHAGRTLGKQSLGAGFDAWRDQWQGQAFMAIGMQDTVIPPSAMHALQRLIRDCPPALELAEAGHFVQEWGDEVVLAALSHYG